MSYFLSSSSSTGFTLEFWADGPFVLAFRVTFTGTGLTYSGGLPATGTIDLITTSADFFALDYSVDSAPVNIASMDFNGASVVDLNAGGFDWFTSLNVWGGIIDLDTVEAKVPNVTWNIVDDGNTNYMGDSDNKVVTPVSGIPVTLYAEGGNDIVRVHSLDAGIYGDTGNDVIRSFRDDIGASHSFYGGDGNDTLIGTGGSLRLEGGADNDLLISRNIATAPASIDTLDGGAGDDRIFGGSGRQSALGGDGADIINTGAGNDTLDGGAGNDTLRGGGDDDSLSGGDDDDRLFGGTGNDTLLGGNGQDLLLGGAGPDQLYGGAGADTLRGGSEDDLLAGGADNDRLFGEAGADTLTGGAGDDTLTGGAGDDQFIFIASDSSQAPVYGATGTALVRDFDAGEDVIWLLGATDHTDTENLAIFLDGAEQSGHRVIYTDLSGYVVTFAHLALADLTAANFHDDTLL